MKLKSIIVLSVLVTSAALLLLGHAFYKPPGLDRRFAAQGTDKDQVVDLQIGQDHFAIPRNYLETIYSSELQSIITIPVYYPDFTPAHGDERPRFEGPIGQEFHFTNQIDHLLIISMVTLIESPWVSVDDMFKNLAHQGFLVRLEPAQLGLLEVHDGMVPDSRSGMRQFVADLGGTKTLISCFDPTLAPPVAGVALSCQYDFPFFDLKVNVYFGEASLADWKEIHQKTTALLTTFKRE